MGFEGEVPPEVTAEYKRMEEAKNMEKPREVNLEEERSIDVDSLKAGPEVMTPEQFVRNVLAREGGDPTRVAQAAHSVETFWLKQLDEGKITHEQFERGVYESVVKMLRKKEGPTAKEEEREEIRGQRMKGILTREKAA